LSPIAKHGTVSEDGACANSPFAEAMLENLEEPGLEINFPVSKRCVIGYLQSAIALMCAPRLDAGQHSTWRRRFEVEVFAR
jgi:hypothetical protein